MRNEIRIAPSILSGDFADMGNVVGGLEDWGADLVHCDVMDGVFVKNITFGPKMVKDVRRHTRLPLDAHLMIVHPENYVGAFADAGADIITVHREACGDNLGNVLAQIRRLGVKCGLVINPDTPVSEVAGCVELCDMVLLMSVFPGFGGQKFIGSVLPKIAEMRAVIDRTGKEIDLEIDGGITAENVSEVKRAGANVIVAGSTVFGAADPAAAVRALREN